MNYIKVIILLLFYPVLAHAQWNDAEYTRIDQSIKAPHFADRQFCAVDYGASSQASASVNQKAINNAIAACNKSGGGKVMVPKGTYLTGPITLLSGVNLVVEKDATLQFVYDFDLFPIVPTRWEGADCYNLQPLIYAYKATDVALTGEGVIDGGAGKDNWLSWYRKPFFNDPLRADLPALGRDSLFKMNSELVDWEERHFGRNDGLRPQMVNFNQCDRVLIEGLTFLRSPFWVLHPLLSSNVIVRGVTVNNDGPNGDGCDPESCNGVLIENCYFNTGDDCIAIKSGRNNDGRLWDRPTENIIIRNCEMRNGHGGVVLGSEISGGCRNLYAENCKMDSPTLDRVIRIKTNSCRGGIIENINARNIKVGQCAEAVLKINLDYSPDEICCRGYLPTVRNVNIENISCGKSQYGVMIIGLDTCTNVSDINVIDCQFNNVADGNYIIGGTKDINFKDLKINGQICSSPR
ncbi:MAG: glycoside hydrolase family 28 protein [Muribaculaceae bacterium]|nr:glycoside hydrolase family 28 protein [Muribaculaceae bacterium]